jgi:chemotaxis protein histidine kinase CheA
MLEDPEIFHEAIEEINELTDAVIELFIDISQSKYRTAEADRVYDTIVRNVHSVKGALGMIGLERQMKAVHSAESFLIDSYQKVKFTPGVVDLMIDFWSKLQKSLLQPENPNYELGLFSECYNCLRRSEYTNVCMNHFSRANKCSENSQVNEARPESLAMTMLQIQTVPQEEVERKIIIIEGDPMVARTLSDKQKNFYKYDCINEVYRKLSYEKLRGVRTIYVDLSKLIINPFLLLTVFKQLRLSIQCCFIVNDTSDLLKHLNELQELSSFSVVSRKSKNFEAEVISLAVED